MIPAILVVAEFGMIEKIGQQSVVLLIGDDPQDTDSYRKTIESIGAVCYAVTTLAEAEEVLRQNSPDAVVVDYALPDGTGIDLIAHLRARLVHRATPIILLTGEISPPELERAVMMGMYAFLAKPVNLEEFTRLITDAITEGVNRVPRT